MVVWLWFSQDLVSFQHLTYSEIFIDRMLHVFIYLVRLPIVRTGPCIFMKGNNNYGFIRCTYRHFVVLAFRLP